MRLVALFVLLFAAYAATLALPGRGSDDRSAREARYLMVATSLHEDGDLAVADEYRDRAYREFHRGVLRPPSEPHAGRLLEGVGIGLPLLAAPLLGLGGVTAVALLCAAAMALAMTLGAVSRGGSSPTRGRPARRSPSGCRRRRSARPRRSGPSRWARRCSRARRSVRCASATRTPTRRCWLAIVAAVQLAVLPWLNAELVLAGLVVLAAIVRWMMGAGRRLQGLVAAEIVVFSAIVYVSVNERLFGGIVPRVVQGGPATGADGVLEHLERVTRLVTLWGDPASGLLAWAPVLALGFLALWLLWRSRHERLALAMPGQRDAEVAATLCALVCGAQLLDAAFLARAEAGAWFPGLHLVAALPFACALCAWGLRRAPRAGLALAALTAAIAVWLVVAVATGSTGLAPPDLPAWLGIPRRRGVGGDRRRARGDATRLTLAGRAYSWDGDACHEHPPRRAHGRAGRAGGSPPGGRRRAPVAGVPGR